MQKVKPELYFHVGAERTGTKFLQFKVFPFFENVHFVNRNRFYKKDEIIAKAEHTKYLISSEFNFKGEFEQELGLIANKYPDAKIILVLRSQSSWINSQYKRLIKNGKNIPFEKYLDVSESNSLYDPNSLLYRPKIEFIEKLFVEKPLILLYDDFRNRPIYFIKTLSKYIDVPFNVEDINLKPKHTSYGPKQLKAIQQTMKYINIDRKKVSNNVIINFLYRIYVDAIRYSVMFGSKLLPDSWFGNEPLITEGQIDKVQRFYSKDWHETKHYIETNKLNKA